MAEWLTMHSSWLTRATWDGGTLFVEFKGGAVCQYDDVPFDKWMGLMAAPSKGKWAHENLVGRPYKLVSG